MGTRITVVYPVDQNFMPSPEALAKLRSLGGAAGLIGWLGALPGPSTKVELLTAPAIIVDLGWDPDHEIPEPAFSIRFYDAYRPDPDWPDAFDAEIPDEKMQELQAILGTPLTQVTVKI